MCQKKWQKARQLAKSNYGLSFTGVAGDPLEGQPTGTVWIGLAEEGQPTVAECFHFNRDRNYIRQSAVMRGLDLLRRRIINKNKYANVCSVFLAFWYKRDMIDLLTGNEK